MVFRQAPGQLHNVGGNVRNAKVKYWVITTYSPDKEDGGVWINQDAWFNLANFDKDVSKEYQLKKDGNGVFVFVIEGSARIEDQILRRRDAIGLTELTSFTLEALENSEILIMEVPMQLPKELKNI